MAADQSRCRELGDLRAGKWISHCPDGLPGRGRSIHLRRWGVPAISRAAARSGYETMERPQTLRWIDSGGRSICFCLWSVVGRAFSRHNRKSSATHEARGIFFGTPAGDNRFDDQHLPVWADHRDRFIYGIPAAEGRGFKMADDTRGPDFEPTSGERVVSTEGLKAMREYLAFRFPAMENAPLLETRVCQYEQSPDSNFIIDRHPLAENVWLLGGGSGHGFKHGPAIGEMMAELVLKDREADPIFRLARFEKAAAIGSGSRFREHSL